MCMYAYTNIMYVVCVYAHVLNVQTNCLGITAYVCTLVCMYVYMFVVVSVLKHAPCISEPHALLS